MGFGGSMTYLKICPHCSRAIPEDATICPYCKRLTNISQSTYGIVEIPPPPQYQAHPTYSLSPPKKKDNNFVKGFIAGFLVAMVITATIAAVAFIIPLQTQLSELQQKYNELSLKYDQLVLDYNKLNQSYIQKVQEYNQLLAEYNALSDKYNAIYDTGGAKFILLLCFQTNYQSKFYSSDNYKYWIYMEVDPSLFFEYREKKHYEGTFLNKDKFVEIVVVDNVIRDIVDMVRSKLVTGSDEEFADALLSLTQNKPPHSDYSQNTYDNLDHAGHSDVESGTHYVIDDYAKYPLETLIFGSGECLDDTILYLALLKAAGFPCAFLFMPEEHHVIAGVGLDNAPTHNYQYPDRWYVNSIIPLWTAECTGYGWMVGDLDDSLQDATVSVVWVNMPS